MPRILVIDDEPEIRRLLRDILEPEGYEVMEAANGNAGIALHQKRPADLIVTDILMPEKEGIETILELRGRFPGVKILAMSGGGDRGNLQALRDATRFGAFRAISKPFQTDEVLLAIQAALEKEA